MMFIKATAISRQTRAVLDGLKASLAKVLGAIYPFLFSRRWDIG
jgi:hypothetical protein